MTRATLGAPTRLVGLALAGIAAVALPPSAVVAAPPAGHRRPNIVFVLTDDLDLSSMPYMPKTRRLIGGQGAMFENYFVSDSLCCPSRATTLRGQYAHNTGVHSNDGTNGGFQAAFSRGIEEDTYATRLQRAGYLTGFFGKYLNHYPGIAGPGYIPPGWDAWGSATGGDPYSEYDYTLNVDGQQVHYGSAPSDYGTDVYFGLAERFIRGAVSDRRPFFAAINVYAPHAPSVPAPEDEGRFPTALAPRTPAFDLSHLGGKPSFIRDLPPFTPEEITAIDRLYRRRLDSIQAVDRAVAHLVEVLRARHELRRTYIVFTSDNGFHLGENRMPSGKETAYDTDIHVPLLVRGPGIHGRRRVSSFAMNTDLAPTFEAMAGARPASFTDGRSLLPLLHRRDDTRRERRRVVLIEHWPEVGIAGLPRPSDTGSPGLQEPQDPDELNPGLHPTRILGRNPLSDRTVLGRLRIIPEYAGLRTAHYLYVAYRDGERELYDLRTDPYEIHNLAGSRPILERRLRRRLRAMQQCRARECRRVENAPAP